MTSEERITALEARLAAAEARIACVETMRFPLFPSVPNTTRLAPCAFCGSYFCGGFHVTHGAGEAGPLSFDPSACARAADPMPSIEVHSFSGNACAAAACSPAAVYTIPNG